MPARFFFSLRFLKLLPLAAMLAIFVAAPAYAQETEEPSELQKIFGAIGLLDLPKDPIDYRERSPLVVPPNSELPRPGEVSDIKQLNPEWPVDQDIKRARTAAKEAKKPIDQPTDAFYGGRRLRPDEIKGPVIKGGAETMSEEEKRGMYRISPTQLGFKGWGKKDELKFEKEPDRTSLLQPPAGYQTPSPNAPYGIVEEEKVQTKSLYDRNDDRNRR
jgi:hypothetical protein